MSGLDLIDLSWTNGIDDTREDCPVRVMEGRAYVIHHCGADIEPLGEAIP